MTIAVNISEAAKAQAEALVLSGRYGSIEQAVEAGLRRLDLDVIDWQGGPDAFSPEVCTAIDEGLAEAEAGRGEDADIVFDRLLARYRDA